MASSRALALVLWWLMQMGPHDDFHFGDGVPELLLLVVCSLQERDLRREVHLYLQTGILPATSSLALL